MIYVHDRTLQKALPMKLTETLNVSIKCMKSLKASAFSFIILKSVEKEVLHFSFIKLVYVDSTLRNKKQLTYKSK